MAGVVQGVDAGTLKKWLDRDEAVLIDVREPIEHAAQRIAGATLVPLTGFNAANISRPADGKKLVLHCKSGMRSDQAARMLVAAGFEDVWNLVGGIEAWKRAGYPIDGKPKNIIDTQRQTFLAVAAMILAGLALGVFVHRAWLILPLIAGLGLLNAGLTGVCYLQRLIARMPCNQTPGSANPR